MSWYKESQINPVRPVAPIRKELPRKLPVKKPLPPKVVAPNQSGIDVKASAQTLQAKNAELLGQGYQLIGDNGLIARYSHPQNGVVTIRHQGEQIIDIKEPAPASKTPRPGELTDLDRQKLEHFKYYGTPL